MAQSLSHVQSASRPNRLDRSASIAVAASVLALIALAPPGNEVQAANDLAALWAAEARGSLGGTHAQNWLYPALTGTRTEAGIPAGVAGRSVVAHKTGTLDQIDNDAGLVQSGPNGAYVLTVMTDGLGSAGWALIASIASTVWSFESARAG